MATDHVKLMALTEAKADQWAIDIGLRQSVESFPTFNHAAKAHLFELCRQCWIDGAFSAATTNKDELQRIGAIHECDEQS